MTDVEMWLSVLQTVGVPSIALAGAGFFIYKNQIWAAEERSQFMARDEESDSRVFSMLERQNENAGKLSVSLEGLTSSHEKLTDRLGQMLERIERNMDRKR
tara:strand:- start:151 stop:453 length:303 start_codon:yes stop_codon:yes gene_type:complete